MLSRLVRQILQATVYDVAIETPLEAAPRISERLNNNIRFKREDLQPVFHSSYAVPITVLVNYRNHKWNVALLLLQRVTMHRAWHSQGKSWVFARLL